MGLLLLGLGRRRRFAGGTAAQRLFGGRLAAVSEDWAIQDLFESAANFLESSPECFVHRVAYL